MKRFLGLGVFIVVALGYLLWSRQSPLDPVRSNAAVLSRDAGVVSTSPMTALPVDSSASPAGPAKVARENSAAAVERLVVERSPEELRLAAELKRAGVEAPPILTQLFERRRKGATDEDLRRFVQTSFPRQVRLRVLTLEWIDRRSQTRADGGAGATRQAIPMGAFQKQ